MRRYLILLLLLGAAAAHASVLITLDNPNQTGNPGDTLMFNGVLSNTGLTTVFLNSVDLNLAGSSFSPDFVDPFLNNVPFVLNPGTTTSDILLFNVLVNNPFTDLPGTFAGTYTLLGGPDSTAQEILGSVDFGITVPDAVPEPSSFLLMFGALLLIGLTIVQRRSSSA